MRKTALVLALCLCACVFTARHPVQAGAAQVNVATAFDLDHPVMRRVFAPWADELRRRTGGRLDLRFFNPGVLVPERDHLAAARGGDLGAGHGPVGAAQSRLLLTGLMDMPSEMTNCLAGTEAFWRLFSASPEIQAEFAGVKVLALHASAPYQLNLAKGDLRGAQDFKNQKLLTPPGGEGARFLRALGFNPLMTPPQDFALSLSRGMADGCILPLYRVRAAGLEGSLSSVTLCDLRMDAYWFGMNRELYDSLPAEARKTLDELSGPELSLAVARVLNELNDQARSELGGGKLSLNELPAAERARWLAQGLPALRESWLTRLQRRGVLSGPELWDRAQIIFRESQDKWAQRRP